MMDIVVNGETRQIEESATVAAVVDLTSTTRKGLAVALDGEIVPKSLWESTSVAPGALLEIVTAAAGG